MRDYDARCSVAIWTQYTAPQKSACRGNGDRKWELACVGPVTLREPGQRPRHDRLHHLAHVPPPRPPADSLPLFLQLHELAPPPSSPSPPLPSHVRQDRGPTQGCRSSERWPTTPGRVVFTKPFSEMKQVLRRGLLYLIQPTYYLPPTWVVTKRTSRKR